MSAATSQTIHRSDWVFLPVFLFFSLLIFWPALNNRLAYDDLFNFLQDGALRNFPNSLFEILFTPSPYPGDLYRPLTRLSYAFDHCLIDRVGFGQLGEFLGLSRYFFPHLLNVLLHGVVCFLIFTLFLKFWKRTTAFTVAALFCVLPIHTEVVASVVGRAELLAALFFLGALNSAFSAVFRPRRPNFKNWLLPLLICFCYLLALLSKESAAVLPLVYLLLAIFFTAKFNLCARQIGIVLGALIFSLLIFVGVRSAVLAGFGNPEPTVTFLENPLIELAVGLRILKGLALLGRYAFLSFIPASLSADYSFAQIRPELIYPEDLGYLLILAAILWGALAPLVRSLRFGRVAELSLGSCGCLWFLICFAVTSNILFPIGTIFAERLVYLPSVGICMLITAVLEFSRPGLRYLCLAILVAIFAVVSNRHSMVWRDNRALFGYQIKTSANSAKTRMNYTVLQREDRKYQEALHEIELAIDIWPNSAQAWYIKGTIFRELGAGEESSAAWLRALELEQSHFEARLALVQHYLNQKDFGEAERYLQPLLLETSVDPVARYAQAWLLAKTGRASAALEIYKQLEYARFAGLDLQRLKRVIASSAQPQ